MKIAILSCFHPYRGGISQFNSCLMQELSKENIVRAFNFKRQYPSFLFPGKTQFVSEQDDIAAVESTATLDTLNPISWGRTANLIKEWNPDILILRYWNPWFALPLGTVARMMPSNCKVLAILDNVIPHERHFFDSLLTRFFLKGADGYLTMCNEVANDLLKIRKDARYIVRNHPVYNNFGQAVPREVAEKMLELTPGKKNILFFGLIRDYKGLDILIDAFDRISPNYELIIAGESYGPFDKYQRQIDASPGRKRIHVFNRFIPDSEVKYFFSAADVCVLPYKSATQSGVSSISYQFGVPLIVTDTGGLKETVGDTGMGLISPSATPAFIAQKIEQFFDNPSIRKNCVENIERAKERLTWRSFCNDMLEFAQNL